jgi:hypothetical protein
MKEKFRKITVRARDDSVPWGWGDLRCKATPKRQQAIFLIRPLPSLQFVDQTEHRTSGGADLRCFSVR